MAHPAHPRTTGLHSAFKGMFTMCWKAFWHIFGVFQCFGQLFGKVIVSRAATVDFWQASSHSCRHFAGASPLPHPLSNGPGCLVSRGGTRIKGLNYPIHIQCFQCSQFVVQLSVNFLTFLTIFGNFWGKSLFQVWRSKCLLRLFRSNTLAHKKSRKM